MSNDTQILKGDSELIAKLEHFSFDNKPVQTTTDSYGNIYYWLTLANPEQILEAAKLFAQTGSRLAIIAAYRRPNNFDICYEFVLEGVVYNITVQLDSEHPAVPSITPLFFNADWHEREMRELFGIIILNQPNPERLFLDPTLDAGIINEYVPLSVAMNGASSTDLWERILASKNFK